MIRVRERTTEGITRARLRLEVSRGFRPFVLYAVFIVVALASGAVLLKNLNVPWPWDDTVEYRIEVDDAAGVVPGRQEVSIAGVPAGKIVAADRVDGRAVLTISLDSEFAPIYRDARVALRPRTQLQDIFVNIESRGTPKAGELTGGERLAAHRTRTQVHLNRVLDVFEPAARARLKQMLDEMSEGLGGDGEQLRAAFVELAPFLDAGARLSRESAERDRTTRRLVHNSRLLFDELARRDRQLTQLVAAGSLTFGELARKRDAFAEMFRQLPPTLRRIDSSFATLRGTLDAVDPALTAFQAPARELAPALRSLRALSADARPALAQLRPAVKELVPTARALPPLSADLGEAFDALRPQAPRLDRITAAIVPCQLAVSKFFHHTISLAKFGDAHGVYPRGEAVFGSDAAGGREPNLHRGRSCTDGEGK